MEGGKRGWDGKGEDRRRRSYGRVGKRNDERLGGKKHGGECIIVQRVKQMSK